jgi:hypothetical protein
VLNTNSNFKYDPAAMVAGDEDALLLANPQNPSGICHDAALLRDLVRKASEKKMYVCQKLLPSENRARNGSVGWVTRPNAGAAVGVIW